MEEISLTFEVSQDLVSRIHELILELETQEAPGKDMQWIRQAVNALERTVNRDKNNTGQLLVNLHDIVRAAYNLGRVNGLNVSVQRSKILDIVAILGRLFYEKNEKKVKGVKPGEI